MLLRIACCFVWLTFSVLAFSQVTIQGNLTIQGNVSIGAVARVNTESSEIKAGEPFDFTVDLDPAPNIETGSVQFTISGPTPNETFGSGCYQVSGDKPSHYRCRFTTAMTASGGLWQVKEIHFLEGVTNVPLKFTPVSFSVIANSGIILPKNAKVSVNVSQVQLLRRAAGKLRDQIQFIKVAVKEREKIGTQEQLRALLHNSLVESLDALTETRKQFASLAADKVQSANADVFFDDLSHAYNTALSRLKSVQASGPHLVSASDQKRGIDAEPLLSLTLRPMEQNELAYNTVAAQGSLTFDLEADSTPEGAAVTYSRKGDNKPTPNPDPTRATIHSLPYAIWIIHFEKPKYKSEEREHDPFREPNHVVHVDLQPQ
jgi:hypothetical protein